MNLFKRLVKIVMLPTALIGSSCSMMVEADIVVTMFPQEDIARAIVGDKLTVHSILPRGIDVHDFEASSADIVTMKNASLVFYTSPIIDPWMNEEDITDTDTKIIDLSTRYELDESEHDDGILSQGDDHLHDHDEIHYWVDPLIITQLADAILEEIIAIDPENSQFYEQNAANYISDIESSYDDFMTYMTANSLLDSTIYFAGHNALGLFGLRHHLDIHPLFEDYKPDEDLDSGQIIDFVNAIKDTGTHYLFIEAMIEPKAANTIRAELAQQDYDLTLLELHSFHNLTTIDSDNNISFIELYERNIANIKTALGGTL